jgi:hypothetical protein
MFVQVLEHWNLVLLKISVLLENGCHFVSNYFPFRNTFQLISKTTSIVSALKHVEARQLFTRSYSRSLAYKVYNGIEKKQRLDRSHL